MASADVPGTPAQAATLPALAVPCPAGAPACTSATAQAPVARRGPPAVKAPKALSAGACHRLEDLPNIGPAMAADLRAIGIAHPHELAHRDAFVLYQSLCALSGKRQDPCVLDTFMAATDFMRGAAPAPWWAYTAQRKLLYGAV
jgi:hypothetical protein